MYVLHNYRKQTNKMYVLYNYRKQTNKIYVYDITTVNRQTRCRFTIKLLKTDKQDVCFPYKLP